MTKLVSWGHWAVGAFFVFLGVDALLASTAHVPGLVRDHSRETAYAFVLAHAFFVYLPAFFCAWGVFKWRAWARRLGIALCAFFAMVGLGLWVYFRTAGRLDTPLLVMTLLAAMVFGWLLLPDVRAEYSRRNQIA